MEKEIRDTILEAVEQALDAQLRAVRRLRNRPEHEPKPRQKLSRSQIDMAQDILRKAPGPLHITTVLERIQQVFGVQVDRESLVSSLTKKVMRGDRFVRTAKNTFDLKERKP